ncbi:MAG: ABC transporter permease [Acidiphilium sp. 37-64-53]|uniref:ABC transporter permease n=1 Tax=Acidiphilium TaxID=522 RepID=UPI000BD0A566|nr:MULTISPECIES: ABC transporter permease [Acidiphilium]OYW01225.1 MAG: ABC transporter permease [Acidiphilium sp. 37-64-53]OZB26357.1 MAG: ABC transporter permease [Acidiphilium sp. 34-64-41]HQT86127.1 ABC transporter permease [Acidiphilium rubrum]
MSAQIDAVAVPKPRARRASPHRTRNLIQNAIVAVIVLAGLALWQIAADRHLINGQLFGSPLGILASAHQGLTTGTLLYDSWVTLYETVAGLLLGSIAGTGCGLGLWFVPKIARPAEGVSIVLNSVPKIALGPLIVIWFGSGMSSKIWLAGISTFAVSMIAATASVRELDRDLLNLFRALGASRGKIFRKLILPSAVPWIFSALRMNIGFALIGAVVGEYIASQAGLGHEVFVAGSLFDLNTVWLGIIVLTLMASLLTLIVRLIEERFVTWKSDR